ncbi:hypothetical protein OG2516_01346 [Oceanicola granulosus HTCC2516]|uniref:Uncharacterized protein n=1 Tax=Oceanicola granulosus (strain ATCC BAA-861 / DSM 15982 / KCTC 12143 / HTCC2516) TaxID=314256 RepID=Q2CG20_OCEGH|nr:hypothetical protein OG2516_01346 [Oceanicola granulosus HTCC2516]
MCSPEIASRCARLVARSSASVSCPIAERSPVTIAAAKAPVSPPTRACTAADSRIRAACSHSPGVASGGARARTGVRV